MIGMITKQTVEAFLKAAKAKKSKHEAKKKKKKKPSGSTTRDWRGVDGALEDAEGKKK